MRPVEKFEAKGKKLDFRASDDEKDIRGVKIELRDVWFRYPSRDVPVLTGLDMTVGIDPDSPSIYANSL